jgi:hypothetical protein
MIAGALTWGVTIAQEKPAEPTLTSTLPRWRAPGGVLVVRDTAAAGERVTLFALGAHPHVLQPIERPKTRRLVAWTLGNFVFGANSAGMERTGILRLQVGHSGVLAHRFRRAHIGGTLGIQLILD